MGGPVKGRADRFQPGTWNVACSMCGKKRKFTDLVRNWQGLYRCPEHNEPRQPQDFAHGIPENIGVPYSHDPQPNFVFTCSINGSSAIPGVAIPGCMIPGNKTWDPNGV